MELLKKLIIQNLDIPDLPRLDQGRKIWIASTHTIFLIKIINMMCT